MGVSDEYIRYMGEEWRNPDAMTEIIALLSGYDADLRYAMNTELADTMLVTQLGGNSDLITPLFREWLASCTGDIVTGGLCVGGRWQWWREQAHILAMSYLLANGASIEVTDSVTGIDIWTVEAEGRTRFEKWEPDWEDEPAL